MFHDLLGDLRYGLRVLRNSPSFTIVAVLTLALGVGANTAVFSIVDALWLRPLPIDDAKHLVVVYTSEKTSRGDVPNGPTSYPDLVDYRAGAPGFAGIAGFDSRGSLLRVGDQSILLLTYVVTENYFSVLGVKALHGRVFTESEFRGADLPREVVVSYGFWQKRLGADPAAVGRSIQLTGSAYTVIGVLPRGFYGTQLPISPDIYTPALVWGRNELVDRTYAHFYLFGRLKPGVDLRQAQAQLDNVARHLAAAYPKERAGKVVTLAYEPATRKLTLGVLFLGIAVLVLLIACANIVTLLLARGETRRREIATRLALGGTPRRIVRQMLAESLLVALAGMAVAIVAALWVIRALPGLLPAEAAMLGLDFRLDYRAVVFSFSAAMFALIVFGVAPAIMSWRVSLVPELKEGGGAGPSRARTIGRNALVVAQVALSVVLLTGAGLLVRTFIKAMQQDPGFDSSADALILQILPDRSRGAVGFDESYPGLLERLATIPGMESAALGNRVPLADSGGGWRRTVYVPGMPLAPNEQGVAINMGAVDGGYFHAVGMRLLRGRTFGVQDGRGTPRVVILNQAAASRLFPHVDALGQHLRFRGPAGPDCEVVGILGDAKYNSITEQTLPYMFVPYAQEGGGDTTLVIRTRVAAASVLPAVRRAIRAFDSNTSIYGTATMSEHMRAALYSQRMAAQLVAILGVLGLCLAVVGLYGVLAYYVNRRRREIGVRIAIGAQTDAVFWMVVRRGLWLAAVGIAVGTSCAVAVTRLLSDLLFGVSPRDPVTLAVVAAVIAVATLVTSSFPALRATRVDPIVALRCE